MKSMKAQNGLKFLSELCIGIMNAAKDSYLLNSKVAFLKSGQNAAEICPFFLRWYAVIWYLILCRLKLLMMLFLGICPVCCKGQ